MQLIGVRRGTAIMLACYVEAEVRALKENENDKDCFCDGGSYAGFRGRFRDFASCADGAAAVWCRH